MCLFSFRSGWSYFLSGGNWARFFSTILLNKRVVRSGVAWVSTRLVLVPRHSRSLVIPSVKSMTSRLSSYWATSLPVLTPNPMALFRPPDPNPNPNPDPNPNPNPNPNPDSGSSTSFNLPAFCDWASIVCDWIDWTKEEPEEEEITEEENINNRGIFDRKFETDFFLSGSCPPDYNFNFKTKYIAGSYTADLSWLCMFFTAIGYPLVFASHCIGAWIFYEIATRRANLGN